MYYDGQHNTRSSTLFFSCGYKTNAIKRITLEQGVCVQNGGINDVELEYFIRYTILSHQPRKKHYRTELTHII